MNQKPFSFLALTLCGLSILVNSTHAQGTAFTYQGRLNSGTNPANGSYDVSFSLFLVSSGGSAIAGPVTNAAVTVSNGLFTTVVNLGNPFTGTSNWLELAVRTNGGSTFTTLMPRQQLTPTPYAIFAESANAGGLVGTVPATQLPASVVTNGASGVNLSGTFTFTGGGPTNLSAWLLNGNSATTNGNFLGTADNQSLEFRVGGLRAGLFSPSNGLPNIIFGTAQNIISNTTAGSSILGGSGNMVEAGSSYSVIGGGSGNTIQIVDDHSVIGGGFNNSILVGANLSVLGGGQGNIIGSSAFASFLGSGIGNQIASGASYSVIGGGNANQIQANAYQSVIGGGNGNTIGSGSVGSFIGSGIDNNIQPNEIYSALVGGNQNVIWTGAAYSFLGGGQFNNLEAGGTNSVLGGGSYNVIQAGNAFLGSGQRNTISNNATYSVLGGGYQNGVGGSYATVPGGSSNVASGPYSFAAGDQAQASHSGAFVWSDVEGTPFASTNANSFNVRANGGVRLVTGGAGLTVDGSPVLAGNLSLAQLPAGVVTNTESFVSLNNLIVGSNLFLTSGSLWLPLPGSLFSGGSLMAAVDTNANSYFGLEAGYYNGGNLGSYNTGIGGNALYNNATGNNNTANGYNALFANTSGSGNVAVGFAALQFSGNDGELVAIGYQALQHDNALGHGYSGFGENTAIGYQALQTTTTGAGNTALGFKSLQANTSGPANTAVGDVAMVSNTSGSNNTASGNSALSSNYTGSDNVAEGFGALGSTYTGSQNVAVGSQAMFLGYNDSRIVAIGYQALLNDYAAGQGSLSGYGENTAVGYHALQGDTVGIDNTALGYQALGVTTGTGGNKNTAIGAYAFNNLGYGLTAPNFGGGTNNIALGYSAGVNLILGDNNIYIGNAGPTNGYVEFNTIRIGTQGVQTATYLAGTVYANGVALTSDRNAKENFSPINARDVLAKVTALPVTEWNYKTDSTDQHHIGPMAQDFQAAFGLNGTDDKHISVVDEGGVALAAIQGLNQKVEEKNFEIQNLRLQNQSLEKRLMELEQAVQSLAAKK